MEERTFASRETVSEEMKEAKQWMISEESANENKRYDRGHTQSEKERERRLTCISSIIDSLLRFLLSPSFNPLPVNLKVYKNPSKPKNTFKIMESSLSSMSGCSCTCPFSLFLQEQTLSNTIPSEFVTLSLSLSGLALGVTSNIE